MTQKQKRLSPNKKDQFIGHYEEAPDFVKDNQFINKGYRINFNTPKRIFRSLFMVHNETMNIWTHLIGALLIVLILGYFLWTYSPESSKQQFKVLFKSKFDSYMDKLHLMGLNNETKHKISQMTSAIKQKYQQFSNLTAQKMIKANQTFGKIIQQMEFLFEQSYINLINAKQRFQNKGAEQVLNAIDHFGDNQTIIQEFKSTFKKFGDKFILGVDSPTYDFLDLTDSPNPGHISRWPVVAMMISAIICLLCSAIFHLFYPMSGDYYLLFARFDYAGINILISGSTIPALYYGLYCHAALAKFYIICISIIAVTLFVVSLFAFMHTQKFRTLKSIFYGSFGLIVSVPLFHMIINEIFFTDGDQFTFLNSLPLFVGIGVSYLGGLVIYTKRCPERHKPGTYDICGHSHQIWHITVILGILFTYLAALQNFEERKKYPVCPA